LGGYGGSLHAAAFEKGIIVEQSGGELRRDGPHVEAAGIL